MREYVSPAEDLVPSFKSHDRHSKQNRQAAAERSMACATVRQGGWAQHVGARQRDHNSGIVTKPKATPLPP